MIAAGRAGARLHAPQPGRREGLARRLPRPQGPAGLLPARLQPGLHRPALDLPGGQAGDRGARASTWSGSASTSGFAHKAFQEKLGIDTPLLADFEPKGEVARAYGAYIDEVGHANRSLVLIDEEGTVEWVHESPTPLEIPGANLIFDALG